MKLTSTESGHALSNHPPWGSHRPRNPPTLSQGEWEQHAPGRSWTATHRLQRMTGRQRNDRLQTQMGFDSASELVPCHLMDGGKREKKEEGGEGVKKKERAKGEKAWGDFEVNILVSWSKESEERKRGGRVTKRNHMSFRLFSACVKVERNLTHITGQRRF